MKISLTESSRGLYFCLSSSNTPSSPQSGPGIKRKALPEVKYDCGLPAVIGDFFILVIGGELKWVMLVVGMVL